MKNSRVRIGISLVAVLCSIAVAANAQDNSAAVATTSSVSSTVPGLINYTGLLKDLNNKPITSITGVTFLLYKDETGGSPVWIETQNVTPDKTGKYTVTLGSTQTDGSLATSFTNGASWLGVQLSGQAEQSRVLLVSVPYAMKAADADTIGGLPVSAFVLANGANAAASGNTSGKSSTSNSANNSKNAPTNPDVTGKGTADYIPMWDTTSDIIDSVIFQKTSEIGIGTTAPAATLDVNGKSDVRDTLTLFPKSTDNTLAVSGTTFKISSNGTVTFITGQKFPGTGTITGITTASGSGLSGGGTTGTLSLKVAPAGVTNAMLQNSKVTLNANTAGGLTTPGAMTLGSTYTIGLKPCTANQVLQYSGSTWNCAAVGTGTVTSVGSGAGLTGGPITSSGTLSIANAGVTNAMLANSKVTLNSGTGITAPGAMTLGDTYTVGINTSVVPQLAAANAFSNSQSVSVDSGNAGLTVTNTGAGDGVDIYDSVGNDGVFVSLAGNAFVGFANDYAGYFVGNAAGSYAESDTDISFNTAAYGFEYGGTTETMGMYGYSASTIGIGVYGQAVDASVTGADTDSGFYPMGVWGDSGQQFGFGVFGSADDGWSFVGYNNSPSGFQTAWLENQESTGSTDGVLFTYGSGFGGTCTIDVSGDVTCSGTIGAAAPVAGGSKKVALNTIQSPENWFEDAGTGQLSGGEAVVNVESVFGETVNTGVEYHVFLTPNGDCKGLYVAQKSATSFVVKELGGGTSSIAFDYRIMAKRKGFEQFRLVDRTEELSLKHRPVKPAGAASKHMPSAQDVKKRAQKNIKPRSVAQNSVPVLNKK